MLNQEYRDLLVQTILGAIRTPLSCSILVNSVQPGAWNAVPADAGYDDAVALVVANADGQGWLRALVERLITDFPGRPEFSQAMTEIDRAAAERPSLGARLHNTGWSALRSLGLLWSFLFAQIKFFAGLLVCLILVTLFFFFVPDDEIAIKTVDEGGGRAKFVNLQYEPKTASASRRNGEPLLLQAPDADGFYRILHREIAEPAQIDLILDEASLPPQWAGNNKKTVLQVVKLNYEEIGLPLWNKSRKLFLYVKLQSFKSLSVEGGSP
jgi:hypothetical protein